MLSPEAQIIIGPQVAVSTTWFDRTFLEKAQLYGDKFPATPPASDDPELDNYINYNYYDQGLCQYIAYERTGNTVSRDRGRKIADSWWQSPHIKAGTERIFDVFTYTPRNASLGGLILRALDGRPDLWDWINAYTRAQFDAWLKIRINNLQLHNGVRDGAFMLQYATWLAKVLPDLFPLQAGGTATNGAALRAQYLADIEAISVNYFYRLQFMDGSWRWDDYDASGGPYIGIMQPFMVGLLLCALCDAHQVVTNPSVRLTIQGMILDGCRHLYSGGPYSQQVVPYFNVNLRGFHYFYHGGTQTQPAKYEKGDFPFDTTVNWHVPSARQAISTILPAFGYAYKLSGDSFFKAAGDEMFDSAYNGTDGVRALMDDTAKNFNQHGRRAGSYKAWLGAISQPEPIPSQPTKTPSPDNTKAMEIIDGELAVWTLEPAPTFRTLRNGSSAGGGQGQVYKFVGGVVYVLGLDSDWYKWTGLWQWSGRTEPGVITPIPTPESQPLPATRFAPWPKQVGKQNVLIALQWKDRYRLKDTDGITAQFEKVS